MSEQIKKQLPACPVCKTAAQVKRSGDNFVCGRCHGMFDGDPDEGGTHSDDPTRRIECEEARANRRPIPRFSRRRRF